LSNNKALTESRGWFKKELDSCLSFWLANGYDRLNGGIYTCLDRAGKIFSTDKSVWMQGRCAWTFARACRMYGTRDEWAKIAESCLDFIETRCVNREAGGRLYFQTTSDGRPLRQRRYFFSEAFYAMGLAEYGSLCGDAKLIERARGYYDLLFDLYEGKISDPAGHGPKIIAKNRALTGLANPMILLNLSRLMRDRDPEHKDIYEARAKKCADAIVRKHFKRELRCTLENVGPNGEYYEEASSCRVVNPGHDIECAWFLLEQSDRAGDDILANTASEMFSFAAEAGWDEKYGGLFYFLDAKGLPSEAYEHDMKLWWPHNELIIASLMLYRRTGDEKYMDWFKKAYGYCREFFADESYGEWFGYLRRDGVPTEPIAKGTTFKGPFHLPRMLMMAESIIDEITGDTNG